MRPLRRYLRGLKSSIALLLPRSIPERPELNETIVLTHLANTVSEAEADDAATAYFSKALSVAGFLGVEEVPSSVANYTEYKTKWRDALLTEARLRSDLGLPLYANQAGPLGGGLDWSTLRKAAYKDRLYQLRPHRFGFLPRLAMAAYCGADALPGLLATLEGWIAQVEQHHCSDAHFSNLVVIYRLLAISWAVPFCTAMARNGDGTASLICLRLLQILAADIKYLWPRLGNSAANNHLLADHFAAWFVATCYPDLCPEADRSELERVWQAELHRQFYADGTNFEQSVHYHELGCEMAVAYLAISLRCGRQPEDPILTQIGKMLRFQAAVTDLRGNVFALGDATDDPLLPLDGGAGSAGGAWRVLYRSLFDPSFPETGDDAQGAERAYWLLAALSHIEKPLRSSSRLARISSLAAFPYGGYAVFHDAPNKELILFRTGPRQGVQVHSGHAMSDLLSVYWSLAGQAVMEPSGTYSYAMEAQQHGGPRHPRHYLRSPAASNSVVLYGHDPLGIPKGRFRGGDNGTRVAMRWHSLDDVLSWAEGRLDESGLLNDHRRGVLHVSRRYTLIYDCFPAFPRNAKVSCHWQLAPEAEVTIHRRGQVSVDLPGISAFVCAGGDFVDVSCVRGQADPPAGWVSRSYGRLQAAPQLICDVRIPARILVSVFGIRDKVDEVPSVEIVESKPNGLLLEVSGNSHRGIACIGDVSVDSDILPFDLDFQGGVLWFDLEGTACREIRALGVRHLRSFALDLNLSRESAAGSTLGDWLVFECQTEATSISGRWRRRRGS